MSENDMIRLDDAIAKIKERASGKSNSGLVLTVDAAIDALRALPAVDVAGVRARVAAAIFDPGKTEGYKGERTLTEWQVDAVMRALIDKPVPQPDKVGYSQAKRDLCLFLDPDLASADAWGWGDDSLFAAALARLTTPKPDQIDTVARALLAEIEGEQT